MGLFEMVSQRMKMLNPDYDADYLGDKYAHYIKTVCEFKGDRDSLIEIIKLYGPELKEYILSSPQLVDVIMQEDRVHRHDLDINTIVDFDHVLRAILTNQELEGFSDRTKYVILLEAMNLYNTYGMETLRTNKTQVKKEIDYGIYWMKTDPNRRYSDSRGEQVEGTAHATRNYEEIMRLGDKYGKDALPYIKHLELLQKRVDSLVDLVEPSLQKEVITLSETIRRIIAAKNTPDSPLQIDAETLEDLFSTYDKVNHLTLKHLMSKEMPSVIDKPTGELLMLHFIQDETECSFDKEMNTYLEEEALLTAKRIISERKGRPYDEKEDQEELSEILSQYHNSRKNPFDLASRLPLRCHYVGKSGGVGFAQVITKPTTLLSVSISTPEKLTSHLNRRIAIGFLPDDIPVDAIVATSTRFNSEKDRVEFSRGKYSVVDIMKYNRAYKNTNETLVDWTQIKPSYILVVKDKEMLEPEILARARELEEQNNLPIVILDKYTMDKNQRLPIAVPTVEVPKSKR